MLRERIKKVLITVVAVSSMLMSGTVSAFATNEVGSDSVNRALVHTVTFDTDGGNILKPVEVEHAFRLQKPNDPIKEGYTFKGWYKEGWSTPFGFSYETIMSDITLVAKWEKNPDKIYRTVTFDTDGGSVVDPVEVEHAFRLERPEDPIKEGYTFVGWYREDWAIPFGFSYETIMSDITLVAKWEKNPDKIYRTVTFDTDGGSVVDPVEVEHAFRLERPEDPIKEGYTFVGWYQEGWAIPFGFAYETIMSDITLVAKWEENVEFKNTNTPDKNIDKSDDSKVNIDNKDTSEAKIKTVDTGISDNVGEYLFLLVLSIIAFAITYHRVRVARKTNN